MNNKLYMILILLSIISLVGAKCPYSGYVPGSPGVVISKWEEIKTDDCFGVCPADVIAEQNAWEEIKTNSTLGDMLEIEEPDISLFLIKAFINLQKLWWSEEVNDVKMEGITHVILSCGKPGEGIKCHNNSKDWS